MSVIAKVLKTDFVSASRIEKDYLSQPGSVIQTEMQIGCESLIAIRSAFAMLFGSVFVWWFAIACVCPCQIQTVSE